MKRVAYAEAVVGVDARVGDLLLEYATRLATIGAADTVHVPAVVDDGPVQRVAMLLGPASQMTMWEDGDPFPGDASDAVADLEHRISGLTATIAPSEPDGPDGPDGPDVLDDLDETALPDH